MSQFKSNSGPIHETFEIVSIKINKIFRNIYNHAHTHTQRLKARKASMAELQSIHSENHVRLYARPTQRKPGVEKKDSGRAFIQLSCGGMGVDRDTYWNEQHTSNTARMVWEWK
jgi:hypothetical protein